MRKTSPGTAAPSWPPRPAKAASGGQSRPRRPRCVLVTSRPQSDPRLGRPRPASHERQRSSKSTSAETHAHYPCSACPSDPRKRFLFRMDCSKARSIAHTFWDHFFVTFESF